jgi:hypothetical protein
LLNSPNDREVAAEAALPEISRRNRSKCILRLICGAIALGAILAVFFLRGPLRALHGKGGDFSMPYVAGIQYNQKLNPYASADFLAVWHAAGAPAALSVDSSLQRPVYPPSTLLLMAPLSRLSWTHALLTYTILCVVLLGPLLYFLAELIGDNWRSWRRWGFVAYGLALAPIHTAIALGNLSILAFIVCMYSLLLAQKKRDIPAGILLGIALCLKPTSGILILLYMLFSKRWRVLCAGGVVTVLITAAAMIRMSSIAPAWRSDYRQNVAYLTGPQGGGNFASPSTLRFDLLNLQVPIFGIVHSKGSADLLTYLLVGALGMVWLTLLIRKRDVLDYWEASGALILLGLLPIYQRNYNACFVLVALLWAFQNIRLPIAKWILAVSAIFLLPGEALLRDLYGHIPSAVSQSMLWNVIIMSQATWGVLALVLLLLSSMASTPQPPSRESLQP